MTLSSEQQQLLQFNQELNQLASGALKRLPRLKIAPKECCVAFMFGKAFKTYNALLLLCEKGYVEDAMILLRSIFEVFIDIKIIMQDGNDNLACRYLCYGYFLKKQYLDSAEFASVEVDDDLKNKIIDDYDKMQEKYKFDTKSWYKTMYERAKDVGLEKEYKTIYKKMCDLSHSNVLSFDNYLNQNLQFNTKPNYENIHIILGLVFEYMIKIIVTWNELLKINIDDDLKRINDAFISFSAPLSLTCDCDKINA